MNRLLHFSTGLLSTQGIFNLLKGCEIPLVQESLVSLIGGICSAILIAWLRWRWEHRGENNSR